MTSRGQFAGDTVRDPWFPIALLLIVVFGVWLGIAGPVPDGLKFVHQWQALIGACVAVGAAYVALRNTRVTERLETHRRSRKHAALRAVLPLALSQVQDYAEQSVRALSFLVEECVGEALPDMVVPNRIGESLPSESLEVLAEFIEYADATDVDVLEATVAWIQIHESRLRGIVNDNNDGDNLHVVTRTELEGRIIDAATIYAGAAVFYDYARRRSTAPPTQLRWINVTGALQNMRLWNEEYPRLHQIIAGRAAHTAGPFERLAAGRQ